MIFSHHVRESKTVFDSGLHAVDSGFQSLVGSVFQILESGFPYFTTVFTNSHANTPLGQSERAYYLYKYIMDSDGMAVAKALAHLICDKALA